MVMVREDPRRPEEAAYILQTPPRPTPREYRVVHARAKEQIAFKGVDVGADFTESPIDAEVAQSLERSWGSMTLNARWPDRDGTIDRMKWGGTLYTFDYRGDNVYGQGDTVSPAPGTCSAALVEISDLLMRFADERDANKRGEIRAELLRQSRSLAERLGGGSASAAGASPDGVRR